MARFQIPASSADYPFAAGYLPQSFVADSRLTDDMERSLANVEVRNQLKGEELPFKGVVRAVKAWAARNKGDKLASA